jgi:cytochrome P450
MFPPAVMIDRQCTKPFEIPELGIKLAVGDAVNVPIMGMHYDPEYFPEPERFDPERFSDENKDKIKPFTYLPFGVGPRNCIGKKTMKFNQYFILFKFN